MKVNGDKTVSMLISELKAYQPKAYFSDSDNNQVQSGNAMKILGFHYGTDVDMTAQVESTRKKFYARKWVLNHLAHVGFSKNDLLKVYRSVILPIHDYCSCGYSSSLTQHQVGALERLHAQALKTIYGYEYSYWALLEMTGLSTLKARREARCLKFARKCLESPRHKKWFPVQLVQRPTRRPLVYSETFARTKRLYNSPALNTYGYTYAYTYTCGSLLQCARPNL